MQAYRNQLRHVVRPDDPSERHRTPSFTISDWQALWLARQLEEYANWEEDDDRLSEIALAYKEYINKVVRNEDRVSVTLYCHTYPSRKVLDNVLAEDIDALGVELDVRGRFDEMREEL